MNNKKIFNIGDIVMCGGGYIAPITNIIWIETMVHNLDNDKWEVTKMPFYQQQFNSTNLFLAEDLILIDKIKVIKNEQ